MRELARASSTLPPLLPGALPGGIALSLAHSRGGARRGASGGCLACVGRLPGVPLRASPFFLSPSWTWRYLGGRPAGGACDRVGGRGACPPLPSRMRRRPSVFG